MGIYTKAISEFCLINWADFCTQKLQKCYHIQKYTICCVLTYFNLTIYCFAHYPLLRASGATKRALKEGN